MQTELDQQIQTLEQTMFGCIWENKRFYGDFLAQTYYYVSHSTRLLDYAASFLQIDRNESYSYFAGHVANEDRHELLASRDLKALGYDIGEFSELPQTRAFYECQYYKIARHDPTVLLGYILLLEAASTRIAPHFYERIIKAHGKSSGHFLEVHMSEDKDHVQKAKQQIDALSPRLQEFIKINIDQTRTIYTAILKAISERQAAENSR